mgnify:CR=1 FL=1
MTVIKNMTNRVKNGENFIIFAEGTRSKEGNKVGEFKGGSFKSAMNARCPIIPANNISGFFRYIFNTVADYFNAAATVYFRCDLVQKAITGVIVIFFNIA